MKYVKTFENFKELPYDLKKLFEQVELYKVADSVYCVVIKSRQLRAFTFLRVQEYYESASSNFQGKKFTWDNYIQWYKTISKGDKEVFTYGGDWNGFNIPSEAIENCYNEVDDPNRYDDLMVSIVTEIKERESGKFYLIGVDKLDEGNDLLDHELSHGFFYTDSDYRDKMTRLVDDLPDKIGKSIETSILELGYNESVLYDEIQAYMSTGLSDDMDPSINEWTEDFEMVFSEAKRKHYTKPEKIELTFLED
jgi:hypothetical protein